MSPTNKCIFEVEKKNRFHVFTARKKIPLQFCLYLAHRTIKQISKKECNYI